MKTLFIIEGIVSKFQDLTCNYFLFRPTQINIAALP